MIEIYLENAIIFWLLLQMVHYSLQKQRQHISIQELFTAYLEPSFTWEEVRMSGNHLCVKFSNLMPNTLKIRQKN